MLYNRFSSFVSMAPAPDSALETATMAIETSAPTSRYEEILKELLRHGEVSVDNLAQLFNVSAATIRRDLFKRTAFGINARTIRHATAPGKIWDLIKIVCVRIQQWEVC